MTIADQRTISMASNFSARDGWVLACLAYSAIAIAASIYFGTEFDPLTSPLLAP